MDLNQLISRIPKPVLVFGVLALALGFIIYNNPMKDDCEIKTELFRKEMRGILTSVRNKKGKAQFAQINFWRDRCREGNSVGACEDYFNGLTKLTKALAIFPEHCQTKYVEEYPDLLKTIQEAIQVKALVAWGEKPPAGASERVGWFTEANVRTFCKLKNTFMNLTEEETYEALKARVYSSYPDAWPESLALEDRKPEDRPKALKSASNPTGTLDKSQVFERSLFSMRCDLYQ